MFCLPVALAWAGSLTGTDVESVRFPCFVLQPTISAVPSHTTFVPKTATQLPVGKQQMSRSHGPPHRFRRNRPAPKPSGKKEIPMPVFFVRKDLPHLDKRKQPPGTPEAVLHNTMKVDRYQFFANSFFSFAYYANSLQHTGCHPPNWWMGT